MRAVLWSGGADSTLVLIRELEKNPDVGIIQFRTDWTKEQKRWVDNFIVERNLTVYTWLPRTRYLVTLDGELKLVDEYAYGDSFIPSVRDILPGDRRLETLETRLTPEFYPKWDILLTGWLHTDKDCVQTCKIGSTVMHSPIWEMDKKDVLEEVSKIGFPEVTDETDTGNIILDAPNVDNADFYRARLATQRYEKLHTHTFS